MIRKVTISLAGLLMVAGSFGDGCEGEEPKPDYITVNVLTEGNHLLKHVDTGELSCDSRVSSAIVRVDIIKAGGERFNFYKTIEEPSCYFTTEMVTFKLYREQPIEVVAYSESVPGGYTQVRGIDILNWEQVYPSYDFGETYTWNAGVFVYWLYN